MTLTISLPSEAEAKLRERARSSGQDVEGYVEQLIARELAAPITLCEAAEPLAKAVDAGGATDEEFVALLIETRDAARRERRRERA